MMSVTNSTRIIRAALIGTLIPMSFALTSCKTASTSSEPAAKTVTPVADGAVEYKVDTYHSSMHYTIGYQQIGDFVGRVNQFDGKIVFDQNTPENSSIRIVVPISSLDSNNKDRDAHLANPDFFEQEKYPEATFESTSVSHVSGNVYAVMGNMTMHGVTVPVAFEFTHTGTTDDGKRIGAKAELVIDRTAFGITKSVDALGAQVRLDINILAERI